MRGRSSLTTVARVCPGVVAAVALASDRGFALAWMHQARVRAIAAARALHDHVADRSTVFRVRVVTWLPCLPTAPALVYTANLRLYLRATGSTRSRAHSRHGRLRQPDGVRSSLLMASGSASGRTGSSRRSRSTGGAPVVLCARAEPVGRELDDRQHDSLRAGLRRDLARVWRRGKARERREGRRRPDRPRPAAAARWARHPVHAGPQRATGMPRRSSSSRSTPACATSLWRRGADARYVPTGHLVYALGNTLLAVPFDVAQLAVTGGPSAL